MAHQGGKIPKAVVLYMGKGLLNAGKASPAGASCEKCMMFLRDTSECAVLIPAKVDGPKGVCGLFVGGKSATTKDHPPPMKMIPAKVAGYSEKGPTRCGNCSHFVTPNACLAVAGEVEADGCCNGWEEESEQAKGVKKAGQMRAAREMS
jgi:hypothetical protein